MSSAPTVRPVLDLPPVQLPSPSRGGGRKQSLALRAMLSLVLLAGVFVLAVLVVVALVAVNVVIFKAGRIQFGLVILPFVVAAALLRGLAHAVKRPPEPEDEIEVPAAEEPELHEEIRQLAAAAGTRPPDRIVVVPEVNAYVREFGPMLGLLPGTRTLAIGTPLLDTLDVSELRSVLAHELGHLAGGDTRLGPIAYRTDVVLVRTIGSLGSGGVSRIFVAYWKLQRRVSASVRRGQEVVADRASVRVAGRQAAADALRDIEVAARADALFKQAYLLPLLQTGHRPDDMTAGWRAILGEPAQVAQLAADAEADTSPIDPWASHPPTPERIRRIAAFRDESVVSRDDRPALALLRQPDRWLQAAAGRWMALVGVKPTSTVVPWTAWGEVVAQQEQAARAAVVDRALGRLGLAGGIDGVAAAITSGRDRDLAAALAAVGWRVGGTDQRRVLLRAAIVATASVRAVAKGASWATSWSGPVALQAPDGATIDLAALADGALDDEWDPIWAAVGADGGAAKADAGPAVAATATATDGDLLRPPAPPFAGEAPAPWSWTATLPARLGKKVTVAVSPDHLGLGSDVIAYDTVAHLATKVTNNAQSGAIDATITVTPVGDAAPIKLRTTATGEAAGDILRTVGYLWELLEAEVGPRVRSKLVAEVEAGGRVEVAGCSLSSVGLAPAKKPDRVVPWVEVGDPHIDQLTLRVPTSGKALSLPIGAEDAYLLGTLIAELRTRHS